MVTVEIASIIFVQSISDGTSTTSTSIRRRFDGLFLAGNLQSFHSKNGKVTETFEETPQMSTYLIAFVISDFKSYKTHDPISSVWAKETLIKDAAYA